MTRPRFRFGLRTVLVVVFVVCCWVGYQVYWIRQRREFVADLPPFASAITTDKFGEPVRAPFPLFLFGEPGYVSIVCISEADQDAVKRLFPEAEAIPPPPPPPIPVPGEPYD